MKLLTGIISLDLGIPSHVAGSVCLSLSLYLSPMKQSTFDGLSYLMLLTAPSSKYFDYLHFIYKKTEI